MLKIIKNIILLILSLTIKYYDWRMKSKYINCLMMIWRQQLQKIKWVIKEIWHRIRGWWLKFICFLSKLDKNTVKAVCNLQKFIMLINSKKIKYIMASLCKSNGNMILIRLILNKNMLSFIKNIKFSNKT